MGTRTFTEQYDDLTGETGEVITIPFSLEGITYEIDLNEKNAEKIRKALAPFIEKGTRTGGRKVPIKQNKMGQSAREIRDWARSNGFEVPDKGLIPKAVREAFAAAN